MGFQTNSSLLHVLFLQLALMSFVQRPSSQGKDGSKALNKQHRFLQVLVFRFNLVSISWAGLSWTSPGYAKWFASARSFYYTYRLTTPRKPSSCWRESHSGDSTHATFWFAFSKPWKICHNIWNFGWIGNLGCASSIQKLSPIGDSCAKPAGAKIQPLKLQCLSAKPH